MQSVNEFEYSQGDLLGHGAFALVFKGRHRGTHQPVAIKQIALKSVPGKLSNIRQKEITILKDLRDVNIVQLFDYVETSTDIYLVMEYCNGGDLGDYLIAKKTLSENSIRHLARHIAGALRVLEKLHIIHRDIKPQNLLLSYPTSVGMAGGAATASRRDRPFQEATVKLADFGFARYLVGADMAATLCGSPLYMAPEILLGRRYDNKADLWSVGTILFQCLSGNAPFLASNPHALRKRYEKENLMPKIPPGTSQYLADLLLQLLKKQPAERMSYGLFFSHDFLKDPSSLPSDRVFGSSVPPPHGQSHTKSSPVPIKRHNAKGLSPHSSPRLSGSPHRGSSSDFCSLSPSSASGPPVNHRVGSHCSLPYYSAHSSNSDLTDQGFIIVDLPGGIGTGSRRCSLPITSTDYYSSPPPAGATVVSPGSHSGNSQTPSSGGSLTRYTSLTTPFYRVPLQRPQQMTAAVHYGFTPSAGTTPTNVTMEPPQGLLSCMPTGASPQNSGFHSNSYSRRRAESLQLCARSPPLPFGKLIYQPPSSLGQPPTSASLSTSPSGGSSVNLCRQKSSSLSPLSTPPSANLPSPVGVGGAGTSRTVGHGTGMRYVLTPHGSGTKLSSLVEEAGEKGSSSAGRRYGSRPSSGGKGKSQPIKVEKSSLTGNFITQSCLLNSDDDGEGGEGVRGEADEDDDDNFPLSLSMNSSFDSEQGQQISTATAPPKLDSFQSSVHAVTFSSNREAVRFMIRSSDRVEEAKRPSSAKESHERPNPRGGKKLERASSFSQQRSHRLTSDLAEIRHRASSLSAHGDPLDPNFTPMSLLAGAGHELVSEVSPSEIVAFKLPFVFSPPSGSQELTSPSFASGREDGTTSLLSSSPLKSAGCEEEEEEPSLSCLATLKQSYLVGRELLTMARARQGPIMLFSTKLSDSGVASRLQRCSEQLVLIAKAICVLESGLCQYRIEQATADVSSLEENASLHIKRVEVETQQLLELCVQEARQVREQQQHYIIDKGRQPLVVSAERLLCLEALDLCKSAVLNEQCGETKECVKRYRRAKMIFGFLLSEAQTHHDKTILNKYMMSIESRIQQLLASL